MSTTFANTINGNDIYAKRAECDAAGNDLSTTYATKSELPDGVPAVTSSDDNKVLKASYSGGTGSYSWQAESGGSDAVYVTWDDTQAGWDTMWTQVQAALSGNKDVFLKDGFCVAELVATNPTQVNFRGLANSTGVPPKITYNYYYLQSGFAHKNVQDQYVLPYPGSGSTGQLLGLVSSDDPPYREPGWVTVSPGPTYSAGTGIDITNNVISADTTVLATKSELPDGVPAVTSSDDNKVLKASYSGGVGSYSWEAESGGTVTDVEVDGTSVVSGGVASITMPTELVPTVTSSDDGKILQASYSDNTGSYDWASGVNLVAGTNVTLTESQGSLTISATGGGASYTAGTGISVDSVNHVITNIGIPVVENAATLCGTFKGDPMYSKNYTFTGTVNTSETTINLSISEQIGVNGITRIWIDPSNSFVLYGSSGKIFLPVAWRLGAGREGSISVIDATAGTLSCRCVDTGATPLTFSITIRYTVSA